MIRPKKITEISGHQVHTAFKAVLNILRKWHCTTEEMQILLGLKRSTLFKYKSMPEKASISHDLTERLSYLLNIHAALRILFSNPDSVYGWVRKPNRAPFLMVNPQWISCYKDASWIFGLLLAVLMQSEVVNHNGLLHWIA